MRPVGVVLEERGRLLGHQVPGDGVEQGELPGVGRDTSPDLADLVVLDRDPFAVPATELSSVQVRATFVDGSRVHGAC